MFRSGVSTTSKDTTRRLVKPIEMQGRRQNDSSETKPTSKNLDLYEVLKHGYTNDKAKQAEFAAKNGYKLDSDLSNHNHQIYYNQKENKLLHNINGTQNIQDWKTNLYVGLGGGKNTDRYREESDTHKKARDKYGNADTTITGHSQGGYHASQLAKDFNGTKAITYNKAAAIVGSKDSGDARGETHHRTLLDPVSAKTFDFMNLKNTIYTNPFNSSLENHNLEQIKDRGIKV